MTDLSIGIIGCGKQGEKHAQSLEKKGVNIFCADIDPGLSGKFSKKFDARVMSVDQIFNEDSIKGNIICTPPKTHYELTKQSMENGKHVLCEKPLTLTLDETRNLKNLELATGQFVVTGYIYRFAPVFISLGKIIKSDAIGALTHTLFRIGGRGSHRLWKHSTKQGGGVVNEMLVHMIDLAVHLHGNLRDFEIIEADLLQPNRNIGGVEEKVDAIDYISIKARTERGMPVIFIADFVTPEFIQYVDAQFSNGSAYASIQPSMPSHVYLQDSRHGMASGFHELTNETDSGNIYDLQMAHFLNVVSDNKLPVCNTIDEAISVMEILDDIKNKVDSFNKKK